VIRAVADTNVLLAGFISPPGSPSDVLLEAHRDGDFELVASPRLLAELDGVLRRPAFAAQAGQRRAEIFLDQLAASMLFVDDIFDPPRVTVDRAGDFLVAVARAAGARYLISAESSLRTSFVRGLTVLSPTEFVTALEHAEALQAAALVKVPA
jgi:predicted nucleic acid-binding protein